MRVLFATTGNDGHFGPLLPFARACAAAGHEVRVAAPESYADGGATARASRTSRSRDAPPELIGPVMARLPAHALRGGRRHWSSARCSPGSTPRPGCPPSPRRRALAPRRRAARVGRAGLPGRPPSAPGCHMCTSAIGMHEVVPKLRRARSPSRWRSSAGWPGSRTGRRTAHSRPRPCSARCPRLLDDAAGDPPAEDRFLRFHEPPVVGGPGPATLLCDPDRPLVYVTFGSVAGSLGHFDGAFREALDAPGRPRRAGADDRRATASIPTTCSRGRATPTSSSGGHRTRCSPTLRRWSGTAASVRPWARSPAGVPQVVVPFFTFDQLRQRRARRRRRRRHRRRDGARLGRAGGGRGAAPAPGPVVRRAGARRRRRDRRAATPPDAVPLLEGLVG